MELRSSYAEDQLLKKRSEKPQEFVVIEKEKGGVCRPGAWFRRLAGAALFAGFLSALALIATLILRL